ncbi:MAG: phosphate transport system regulatory protein PhoU [Candidatus Omnitrophota bacterium]|nr:MAG: phosphate transport system regulatory protein PhoU [Candidatus Omnitrophota bacterium]
MERHFDNELQNLKEKLVEMAEIVEEMIKLAVEGLKERKKELLQKVFDNEKDVNLRQIENDDLALKLIALHQPAASDLRLLVTAIKISSDLERIADQAVNISERGMDLLDEPPLKPLIDIPRMAEIAQAMVKDAIDAFVNGNSDLAHEVCKRDDMVDDLNDQIFRELLTYMMQDTKNVPRALKLLLVARHLERIADHATNIGEEVYYIVKGKDIRHHIE